jgi:nucleotide-binding universal stress UspA family protein
VTAACSGSRVDIRNVLFATDFSDASQNALTFALSLARLFGATIYALHVVTPEAYSTANAGGFPRFALMEDAVKEEMDKLAAQMSGVRNEAVIERAASVWTAVEETIERCQIDLMVVGTHGRTGMRKMLLGSTAEAIFRRARIPVLTIGPAVTRGVHGGGQYRCVLFASDLREDSLGAAAFAFSMAEENDAKLVLLHAASKHNNRELDGPRAHEKYSSAASMLHELHELIPADAETWCRPEVVLRFGEPTREILSTAKEKGADLLVMGTHRLGAGSNSVEAPKQGVSYKVVVRSRCPVLTVRG